MLFELMYRFLQEPPMSCSYSDIATAHFDSRAENYTLKPRNTRAEVFLKTKFTGKHLCQSLFFNKRPAI